MDREEEKSIPQPHAAKILGKLQENRGSIYIYRVPPNTKKAFQDLAQKEFCGDYGMLLKWLMDDLLSQDTRLIMAKLENHEIRIATLENASKSTITNITNVSGEDTTKEKKMIDGSTRRVKK